MKKKYPSALIKGMVVRRLATTMIKNNSSYEDAYVDFADNMSDTLSMYDFDSIADELETKTLEKVNDSKSKTDGSCGSSENGSCVSSEEMRSIKQEPQLIQPNSANMSGKPIYERPLAIKTSGQVELKQDADGNFTIKKGKGTKKIAIKCKTGAKGVLINKDTVGCQRE